MSAENEPVFPAPVEVDLDDLVLLTSNAFRLWLRFEDGRYLALDFRPGSEPHHQLLDVLTEVVTERVGLLGRHGVVITGMTGNELEGDKSMEPDS